MKKQELQDQALQSVQDQHDLFLIELFGIQNSGLSPERIKDLAQNGTLKLDTKGLQIAGLDPYAFLFMMGQVLNEMNNTQIKEARDWGLSEWEPVIKEHLKSIVSLEPSQTEIDGQNSTMETPAPSYEHIYGEPLQPPRNLPSWMGDSEKQAYSSAVQRAGIYARGLGNQVGEDLNSAIAEGWEGTEITEEVNEQQRQFILDTIKQETANEIVDGRDYKALASRLADITKDYSRNWDRIARTELQAAYNEGRLLDAIDQDSLVARFPNTSACDICLSLFVDGENLVLFEPDQLIANGVNVGRSKENILPTLFPVHPNCRCDTLPIPRGFIVTKQGRMLKETITKSIPSKYLRGLEPDEKEKRTKQIEQRKQGKIKATDKYKPLVGDDTKTKPSKYSRTSLASAVREKTKGNTTQEFIKVASQLTGVSKRIISEVHKRGAEAWATSGHRPGATQIAWARARVYSFLTGGKTRRTADADLWADHLKTKN